MACGTDLDSEISFSAGSRVSGLYHGRQVNPGVNKPGDIVAVCAFVDGSRSDARPQNDPICIRFDACSLEVCMLRWGKQLPDHNFGFLRHNKFYAMNPNDVQR